MTCWCGYACRRFGVSITTTGRNNESAQSSWHFSTVICGVLSSPSWFPTTPWPSVAISCSVIYQDPRKILWANLTGFETTTNDGNFLSLFITLPFFSNFFFLVLMTRITLTTISITNAIAVYDRPGLTRLKLLVSFFFTLLNRYFQMILFTTTISPYEDNDERHLRRGW